jgi:hypothetical protein
MKTDTVIEKSTFAFQDVGQVGQAEAGPHRGGEKRGGDLATV